MTERDNATMPDRMEIDMFQVVRTAMEQSLASSGLAPTAPIELTTLLVDVCPHSVALLQAYTLMVDALGGWEFPTAALFDYPSVGELAGYLAEIG